jgi:peptide/nickel transport system substrate-binding protein
MKRRTLLTAAPAALAALAAPGLPRAAGASTLKFVPQADLAVLDSVWATAYVTRNHSFMVFDTLYGVDENYHAQPQMVDGHTVEKDGTLWTLTLRDGLRFHDGTPVLARDAVASIQRWAQRDAFGILLAAITDQLSAPDDKRIVFRLQRPFPALPYALGHGSNYMLPVMPERLARTPVTTQVTEMTGSGPFRFVAGERVPGSLNVYRRFDGYVPRPSGTPSFTAGPKRPLLERIEWHTIPDAATIAGALRSGEIDWWEQPSVDLLPLLRRDPALAVAINDPAGNIGQLRLNELYPPFDNPAIRRAVLGAVNQADFMTAVVGDDPAMWKPCGVFTPGTPLATDAGMGPPRDYEQAKRDLAAAGYRGEPVVMLAATDYPVINAMCEVVADMFRKIGMTLDYQSLDWGTVVQRRNSMEPPEHGGWNAHCTFTAGFDLINPGSNQSLNATGRAGFVGWPTSPRLTSLRKAWFDAPDLAAQQAICRDIQLQFFQDVPYVPLGQFFQAIAHRNSVRGIPKGAFTLFYNVEKT